MEVSTACSTFGDPRNPPILFLHGIRLGREIWLPHARELADRYHVITLDLPGHGALAHLSFTQRNVSALIDDAIENVAQAPPLIVGYSLGGFIAMRYAARNPERTRALLGAACTLDATRWTWWPFDASMRLTRWMPQAWLDRILHATLRLALPHDWAALVERIPFNRHVLAGTAAFARGSGRASDRIAAYRKPVLFVNGEYDLLFRFDERRFLGRVPQAQLHIVPAVDHAFPMRRVAAFTAIVRTFAEQVFALAAPIA